MTPAQSTLLAVWWEFEHTLPRVIWRTIGRQKSTRTQNTFIMAAVRRRSSGLIVCQVWAGWVSWFWSVWARWWWGFGCVEKIGQDWGGEASPGVRGGHLFSHVRPTPGRGPATERRDGREAVRSSIAGWRERWRPLADSLGMFSPPGSVLVVWVVLHMLDSQPLCLLDKWPLLFYTKALPFLSWNNNKIIVSSQ